jgi:hypothetical protein
MFFQIHRDGQAVDGSSYPTLVDASAALEKADKGGQVAEVDASDRIIHRLLCRSAVRRRATFGTMQPAKTPPSHPQILVP